MSHDQQVFGNTQIRWLCSRAESIFIRMCALLSIHTYAWQCFDLTKNMKKKLGEKEGKMSSALLFLIMFFQNCFSLFLDLSTGESVWGLVGHIFIHTYGLTFYQTLLLHTKNIFSKISCFGQFSNFLFYRKIVRKYSETDYILRLCCTDRLSEFFLYSTP